MFSLKNLNMTLDIYTFEGLMNIIYFTSFLFLLSLIMIIILFFIGYILNKLSKDYFIDKIFDYYINFNDINEKD